jgi:hypothetical protein
VLLPQFRQLAGDLRRIVRIGTHVYQCTPGKAAARPARRR